MEYGVHETCPCGSQFQLHSDGDNQLLLQLAGWRANHEPCLQKAREVAEAGMDDVRRQEAVVMPLGEIMHGGAVRSPMDVLSAARDTVQFIRASRSLANKFRNSPLAETDDEFATWLAAFDALGPE